MENSRSKFQREGMASESSIVMNAICLVSLWVYIVEAYALFLPFRNHLASERIAEEATQPYRSFTPRSSPNSPISLSSTIHSTGRRRRSEDLGYGVNNVFWRSNVLSTRVQASTELSLSYNMSLKAAQNILRVALSEKRNGSKGAELYYWIPEEWRQRQNLGGVGRLLKLATMLLALYSGLLRLDWFTNSICWSLLSFMSDDLLSLLSDDPEVLMVLASCKDVFILLGSRTLHFSNTPARRSFVPFFPLLWISIEYLRWIIPSQKVMRTVKWVCVSFQFSPCVCDNCSFVPLALWDDLASFISS
jgi:hypothetical protein